MCMQTKGVIKDYVHFRLFACLNRKMHFCAYYSLFIFPLSFNLYANVAAVYSNIGNYYITLLALCATGTQYENPI